MSLNFTGHILGTGTSLRDSWLCWDLISHSFSTAALWLPKDTEYCYSQLLGPSSFTGETWSRIMTNYHLSHFSGEIPF